MERKNKMKLIILAAIFIIIGIISLISKISNTYYLYTRYGLWNALFINNNYIVSPFTLALRKLSVLASLFVILGVIITTIIKVKRKK